MKNKLFRKLSVLTLTLLVSFVFAACTPEIHVHTGESSSETATTNETITSTQDTAVQNAPASRVETGVASSEKTNGNSDKKEDSAASKAPSTNASTSSQSTSSKAPSTSSASSGGSISKADAKATALKDAGLNESQIYDYEIELDRDKGVLHYDVSFEYKGKDYDYEINAETGKIISVEKPSATSDEAKISKSDAKDTALKHAGVKAADISFYEIELEKDNGIWKYEISFKKGNVEYDYTINAENGKILHSEKDIDD